jgi:hypothetical protein
VPRGGGVWGEGGWERIFGDFCVWWVMGGHNGNAQENHVFLHSLSCREDTDIVMFFLDSAPGPSLCTELGMFLEVFVCIVEKFEEVRGLSSTKAGDGGIILVRVIFAGKLLVVDLYFGFGRAESKAKNGK